MSRRRLSILAGLGSLQALPGRGRSNARRVLVVRGLRGLVDGLVGVLLASYLTAIGFNPLQVGAIVTGTLLGSAALTLGAGVASQHLGLRGVLLGASALMVATGLGFSLTREFWLVMVVAVLGTMNPSQGDVSPFLPTEQALLAGEASAEQRPRLYASYNVAGGLAVSIGALGATLPAPISRATGWTLASTEQLAFLAYAAVGVAVGLAYLGLEGHRAVPARPAGSWGALGRSRRTVLELAALFSLDSAASGLVGTALLVLWLQLRFGLSPAETGVLFSAAGLLGAASQFLAGPLAARLGLVRTMAYTHLPANAMLVLAAFAPSAGLAVAALLARALCSQMDVPARQSLVMAVVDPPHRAAAASVTNVPRSLASAATPLLAGWLLTRSAFGWPLVIAGLAKISYDLILLLAYRHLPEEPGAARTRRS